jgi:hypothetical protein
MNGPAYPQVDDGMQFLNGYKTITGLLGTIGVGVVQAVAPKYAPVLNGALSWLVPTGYGIFGTLLSLGLIHKKQKAG